MLISFIIPTLGTRPESLEIAKQSILRNFADRQYQAEIIVESGQEHPSVHRNNGLAKAQGEYIVYLDDDDQLVDSWLDKAMVAAFNESIDYIMYHSVEILSPSTRLYSGIPPNRGITFPAGINPIDAPTLYAALSHANSHPVGSYVMKRSSLGDIKWPVCSQEDFPYNKTVFDKIIHRQHTFRFIPMIKHLYFQSPKSRQRGNI